MKEILISDEELTELVNILFTAQGDSLTASLSHDTAELDAYREHQKIIRKWIRRLQQLQKDRKA